MRPLTNEQVQEFEKAVKPLIKWINDNHNPHVKVIVDSSSAELVSGETIIQTDEYMKD